MKRHEPFAEMFKARMMNRASGLEVFNKTGPKATIRIYDEIGFFGITAEAFADEIEDITADEIEVQINSMGGDVFDGIAIYNALRTHEARITTRVDGMAASIASVIVQAGDERIMLTGSQMMIHPAWGFAMGDASVMRKLAEILDKQTDIVAGIYTERAGDGGFRELMDAETWFDADETVEAGLADQVVVPDAAPSTENRTETRFTEQADAAVAALDVLADRTEEVVTFRAGQGKPPLSEDSVEIFRRLEDVKERLDAIVAETEEADSLSDAFASEYAKYVRSSQGD